MQFPGYSGGDDLQTSLCTERVYFKFGVRVVGHRFRRDMAPVTPEAVTYVNSARDVK